MTRVFRGLLLFVLLFAVALPVLAQDDPLVTTAPAITVESGGTLTLVQDAPVSPAPSPAGAAFAGMLLLATSVFFVVEQVKPAINAQAEQSRWSEHVHQFAIRGVAALVALFLIFSIPNVANIVVAFGLTWDIPDVLAKVITALAVSGGSAFIYALKTFFQPSAVIIEAIEEDDEPPRATAYGNSFRER